MRPRLTALSIVLFAFVCVGSRGSFLETLSFEQKKQMGLDQLTAAQAAAINEAVEHYQGRDVAVLTQKAAATAVEEYKAKQEPGVVARALNIFKQKQEEASAERLMCHIQGSFNGWAGGTLFALDNGQVWQQVGSEVYYLNPVTDAVVELRKVPSGYHRLYLSDGRWVTVKRVR